VVDRADVVIVGAGPAGLATAIRLGQLGVRRFIIVDRQNFPRDKTCGSAITAPGIDQLKRLGAYDAIVPHSHGIDQATFKLWRGRQINFTSPIPEMLVCPRRVLDKLLLDQARDHGAIFIPNFHVSHLLQREDRICGVRSSDGREIQARFTVVADGVHSRFAPERAGRRLISTIMGWWETAPSRHGRLEFVYDRKLRPFYGWWFAEGPTIVNIGIGYEDTEGRLKAREVFAEFLDRHYRDFIASARQIGPWKGQPISSSFKIEKLTSPGRIVVGEAGRIVHPATGEGIYQAFHSGVLAAEALHATLCLGTDAADALERYEAACRDVFDRPFRIGRGIRSFIGHGGIEALSVVLRRTITVQWRDEDPSGGPSTEAAGLATSQAAIASVQAPERP
jgi:geranylgeranyl reductase family protein